MKNIENCKVISGSDLYYRILFLDKSKKNSVIFIHALYEQIKNIPYECREAQIGLHKLNWWQTEIQKLYNHQPEHPLTIVLHQNVDIQKLPQALWNGIIEGTSQVLSGLPIVEFQDLILFCHHTYSLAEMLCAYALVHSPEKAMLSLARDTGAIIGLIDILQNTAFYFNKGFIFVPQILLDKYGLTGEMLQKYTEPQKIHQAIGDWINAIKIYSQETQNHLLKSRHTKTYADDYFMSGARIAKANLKRISKKQAFLLKRTLEILPIQKFLLGLHFNFF